MQIVPGQPERVRYRNHWRYHRMPRMLAAILVCVALAGCGQKGPLFQPEGEAVQPNEEPAAVTAPARASDDAGAGAVRKDTVERRNDDRANDRVQD